MIVTVVGIALVLFGFLAMAAEEPSSIQKDVRRKAFEPDPLIHLRPAHPRLLCTAQQLAASLAAAQADPLLAAVHARIIANAESALSSTPIKRELLGPRLLDKSRTCVARVLTCAMAYRLGGDTRFARRAIEEMLAAAGFSDWNPAHFLDVAEMSLALAVGYDWLHAKLTPDERTTIKSALLKHVLAFAPGAYAPVAAEQNHVARYMTGGNNWNQVCNSGLLAAALALADEEPALARTVIAGVRRSLPFGMAPYAPDGAYPEGPGYWDYGTTYNVIALAMLESALGTDFDLGRDTAFARTALYRLHVQSPAGFAFNYADGNATLGPSAAYTWLAQRYTHAQALAHSRALLAKRLEQEQSNRGDRFFALNAIWFPARASTANQTESFDIRFRGPSEFVVFRSAWDDPHALFVGFKAGRNNVGHAHLDLGSFVLDADGVRWAHDLGPDNYNLPSYFDRKPGGTRWRYFRMNNRSHNTLTPGDRLQEAAAEVPIVAYHSAPAHAFAIADLTPAYPGAAARILRGIAMLDRARVLVQDEITGLAAGTPLVARLFTSAEIELDGDRTATLTQSGRRLRAEILTPKHARFTKKPATPPTPSENQNKGVTELAAEISSATTDTRLVVLLTPIGDGWPALPSPALSPLTEWR